MGHKKLQHIIPPVQRYVAERGSNLKRRLVKKVASQLPYPYEAGALRGEGLLRIQFFNLLERKGINDPQRQVEVWHALVTDRGRIIDYVQRIGLLGLVAGQHEALQNLQARADFSEWAFKLYCGLLDDLSRQDDKTLFDFACTRLLQHHLAGLYPKSPQKKKLSPEQLKQQSLVQLQKHWGYNIQLKESFQVSDEGVTFALRVKPHGEAWIDLLQVAGERLKPTRILAYQEFLDGIKAGRFRPEQERP